MDLRDERDAVVEDAPLAARDAVSRARQLAERLGDDSGFVRSVSVNNVVTSMDRREGFRKRGEQTHLLRRREEQRRAFADATRA
jgi:hypothetical protein